MMDTSRQSYLTHLPGETALTWLRVAVMDCQKVLLASAMAALWKYAKKCQYTGIDIFCKSTHGKSQVR